MSRLSKRRTIRVVGVSFVDGYPRNLRRLAELERSRRGERLAAVLIRDVGNMFDANAIEVHVPAVGKVGSIPRSSAAALAARLDAGDRFEVTVFRVVEDPWFPDRPGVEIGVARVLEPAVVVAA